MNKTIVIETPTRTIEIDVAESSAGDEALIKHYVTYAQRFMNVVKVLKAYIKGN